MVLKCINKYNKLYIENILTQNKEQNLINKQKYSQYYTSPNIAIYMAYFFKKPNKKEIRILEPGAGEGVLIIAFILRLLQDNDRKVKKIFITLYEIDMKLIVSLKNNMDTIVEYAKVYGLEIIYEIKNKNFILKFNEEKVKFNYIITNPPYMKLSNDSEDNKKLLDIGINVPNYYAAFITLSKRLLLENGEIVAITPRSFCNGRYYLWFRKDLISDMTFDKIHLFESRKDVFKEDDILQENIIYHCIKKKFKKRKKVKIMYTYNNTLENASVVERNIEDVIYPNDSKSMIRILKDNQDEEINQKMNCLNCDLKKLNIEVSTGPIVDFREDDNVLTKKYENKCVPIIFCEHISKNGLNWPRNDVKKYNYIKKNEKNRKNLRKNGNFVILKRMTSKEEQRRIISCVWEETEYKFEEVTFDNKVNYFHRNKSGLPILLAKGLSIYLNSSIVDVYFRTFSGNTQVNVTDLRSIKYPNKNILENLGSKYELVHDSQELIDGIVEEIVFNNN
ncbi:MAG: Eco57I restriction-modification methylase domain-containing protein [Clostridium sp.]|uniref:Eco57I restriction-modification methylase domain-containing protein n=1 Tax=Clostridium TaxID=1485 RepID=UPI0008A20135|nr:MULTISPECIES: Eco57I restriction-modification methylase domain-containing protein [Clostridium]MDU3090507.1 Eco57I restriction-modification methylase domain-containing protein [Clostridium sp.]OFS20397.1 hypothetical protein HMPREF3070_16835 [Clostridium sp. HMSC19A10]